MIDGRNGRRLGQHTVIEGTVSVGLDSHLGRLGAQHTNKLYVVSTATSSDHLQANLEKYSTSPVVLRVGMDPDSGPEQVRWMLDEDQVAGLVAHHWDLVKLKKAENLIIGAWTTRIYRLSPPTAPDEAAILGGLATRAKMQTLDLKAYGHVVNPADVVDLTKPTDGVRVVRPSVDSGNGHRPGIELTPSQLETLSKEHGFTKLHLGSMVSVRRTFSSAVGPEQLRIPATLRARPDSKDTGTIKLGDNQIGVDKVIRLALGVAVWEQVTVEPMVGQRWAPKSLQQGRKWRNVMHQGKASNVISRGDHLMNKVAPAVHVVARVQPAELTLTEQEACLLTALALDALGLSSGDEIVLHAAYSPEHDKGDSKGVVHVKRRLKAYAATSDVVERRMHIYGGGRGAPMPSEDAALQFSQALPWIWLDAAIRQQMGLPDVLGALIVAPSRRYLLADNLREVAIVSAVALGGVAASTEGGWSYAWAAFAVVIPVLLIALRVRSKLR